MDEKTLETTDEIDEVLDWMVDVFSENLSQSSESSTVEISPNPDLTQIEVGITENHLDYVTDGANWKWFD